MKGVAREGHKGIRSQRQTQGEEILVKRASPPKLFLCQVLPMVPGPLSPGDTVTAEKCPCPQEDATLYLKITQNNNSNKALHDKYSISNITKQEHLEEKRRH